MWSPSLYSFSFLKQMVSGVLDLYEEHEGLCKGCAPRNNVKKPFPSSESRSKEDLDLIHSNVCGLMLLKSLIGSL